MQTLIIFISSILALSLNAIGQGDDAADVYADNNTNCPVEIRFYLHDYSASPPNTTCDDPHCSNWVLTTNYTTVPANTSNYQVIVGSTHGVGSWYRVEMQSPDIPHSDVSYDSYICSGSLYNGSYCNTAAIGIGWTSCNSVLIQ